MSPEIQREKYEKIFGRSDKDIAKRLAKDLFHENLHGLDFGSGRLSSKEVWERWINLDKLVIPGHLPAIDDPREVQFKLDLDNIGK